MPVKRATMATRIAVSDILAKFLGGYDRNEDHLSAVRSKFGLYEIAPDDFKMALRKEPDIKWKDQSRIIFLEPICDEGILPLLTLQSSDNWQHFSIYALLTQLDKGSNLQSLILRFETDEGENVAGKKPGKHDFLHAQLCRAIYGPGKVILAQASTPEWLPDSQPSFPLDADNQVNLVLCMLISLYGGAYVRLKLFTSGKVNRNLRKHLNEVRALKDS